MSSQSPLAVATTVCMMISVCSTPRYERSGTLFRQTSKRCLSALAWAEVCGVSPATIFVMSAECASKSSAVQSSPAMMIGVSFAPEMIIPLTRTLSGICGDIFLRASLISCMMHPWGLRAFDSIGGVKCMTSRLLWWRCVGVVGCERGGIVFLVGVRSFRGGMIGTGFADFVMVAWGVGACIEPSNPMPGVGGWGLADEVSSDLSSLFSSARIMFVRDMFLTVSVRFSFSFVIPLLLVESCPQVVSSCSPSFISSSSWYIFIRSWMLDIISMVVVGRLFMIWLSIHTASHSSHSWI